MTREIFNENKLKTKKKQQSGQDVKEDSNWNGHQRQAATAAALVLVRHSKWALLQTAVLYPNSKEVGSCYAEEVSKLNGGRRIEIFM